MILLFHHVAPPERAPADAKRRNEEGWGFRVSPQGFERQLRILTTRGYRFVSLGDYVTKIRSGGLPPADAAVVTFDDGWTDNYEFALPILKRLGVPACFFLTTAHISRPFEKDASRMHPHHIRELSRNGMTLGGHTRTHPDLRRLSEANAREEIAGCRKDIEDFLGHRISFFAYPGGSFDARIAKWTREAGYEAACSTLAPARNTRESLFWLFRDVFSESMSTLRDRCLLSSLPRAMMAFRTRRRLAAKLSDRGAGASFNGGAQ